MNIFLGISLADAIKKIKGFADEKLTAVDIGNFVCRHYIIETPEAINGLNVNDIASAFDSLIAKLYSDIDIRKSAGYNDGEFTQEDFIKISKAGNYVRYAAYDLIKGLKAYHNGEHVDFEQIMVDAIDRKIEEDTVDPASEAEVEELINDTEEIMNEVGTEGDSNPFYDGKSEENSNDEGNGYKPTFSSSNGDDGGKSDE